MKAVLIVLGLLLAVGVVGEVLDMIFGLREMVEDVWDWWQERRERHQG